MSFDLSRQTRTGYCKETSYLTLASGWVRDDKCGAHGHLTSADIRRQWPGDPETPGLMRARTSVSIAVTAVNCPDGVHRGTEAQWSLRVVKVPPLTLASSVNVNSGQNYQGDRGLSLASSRPPIWAGHDMRAVFRPRCIEAGAFHPKEPKGIVLRACELSYQSYSQDSRLLKCTRGRGAPLHKKELSTEPQPPEDGS